MANLFILIVSPCALAKKWLFWLCEGSALWEGARPNVPLAGWHKIVFKKCGWEKNKKHRVGNEFRLTRCPFVISFLCLWLPVTIVYFFLFLSLFCLSCRCLNTLAANSFIMHPNSPKGVYIHPNWYVLYTFCCFSVAYYF